jgi:hypothetical protein
VWMRPKRAGLLHGSTIVLRPWLSKCVDLMFLLLAANLDTRRLQ